MRGRAVPAVRTPLVRRRVGHLARSHTSGPSARDGEHAECRAAVTARERAHAGHGERSGQCTDLVHRLVHGEAAPARTVPAR
ncbi:hypothetical protein [Streptomyces sp. NPDC051636]|uniref:hypothetical protein n=1 Tax=Streptomyces sp. NPDC051636 TaxID=3365663 RepID=UPI0037B7A7E4